MRLNIWIEREPRKVFQAQNPRMIMNHLYFTQQRLQWLLWQLLFPNVSKHFTKISTIYFLILSKTYQFKNTSGKNLISTIFLPSCPFQQKCLFKLSIHLCTLKINTVTIPVGKLNANGGNVKEKCNENKLKISSNLYANYMQFCYVFSTGFMVVYPLVSSENCS